MAEEAVELDIFERDIIIDDLRKTLQFASTDEEHFLTRTKDLTSQQRKFTKVQSKIEKNLVKLKLFNKDEQLKIRNDFNDLYYAIVANQTRLKKADEDSRRMSRTIMHKALVPSNAYTNKLPKLSLPSFSGESTDWPSFYDLFTSLVHNNDAYSDAEKFRYLLLTLKNEPYNLIKSIPITDENYSVALDMLVSRYENKRAIATKHLDKIFDIDYCTEKSSQSLRNLLNIYQENIKALEMMQFPVRQWSFLLLNILLRKITPAARKRFELSLPKPSDVPTVDVLVNFLERELSASEMSSSHFDGQSRKNYGGNVGSVGFTRAASTDGPSQGAPPKRGLGGQTIVYPNTFTHPRRSIAANMNLAARDGTIQKDSRPCNSVAIGKHKSCICCNAQPQHSLTKCTQFLNLSPRERLSFIMTRNVCENCLAVDSHSSKECRSSYLCRFCQRPHHSYVHIPSPNQTPTQCLPVLSESASPSYASAVSLPPSEECDEVTPDSYRIAAPNDKAQLAMTSSLHSTPGASSNARCARTHTVLLSTALVDVCVGKQKHATIRCLIDTGSQATFITEACAQRLNLARRHVNVPVYGIDYDKPVHPKGVISCCITPRNANQPSIPINALVLPKLTTHIPSVPLPHTGWPHIAGLTLADPSFHTPQPVEMLIGADILSHILLGEVIPGSPGSPVAMNSIFGYLLLGSVSIDNDAPTPVQACHSSFNDDMDLQKFWMLESAPEEKRTLTPEELLCESIYEESHTRDETGRYIVPLPFRPDAPPLGESRDCALARFKKLEYRLERNPTLKADYHACLQEYVDLNHMEIVDSPITSTKPYYIPHHCIVKESSETTKTRVVFDAGSRTTNGNSLNDVLLTGPKLHQDIVDVLLKFRIHSIVLTADIKQMYRNILVRESDRDFQRILWRSSPDEPLNEYRLRTVTFGVSSSPYLALRTIKQLALDEACRFKRASDVLLNEVFVDDIICGDGTEAGALALQQELIDICHSAGFELRKWHSNSPAILAAVLPPDSQGERPDNVPFAEMENDNKTKVLGLQWNPNTDVFTFSVRITSDKCTKRAILSEIAKIYDPMGWLSPVTVYAKYLIQLLWISGVEWDETPPTDIITAWLKFTSELPLLSQVVIPRHVFPITGSIQLHGFSDASERAYSGCLFLRLEDAAGNVKVFLLLGKTRVSPLARLSIPRLELMGAVLLSKLISIVMRNYGDRINCANVYAWTDSSIVLAWLRSSPHEWKTYVANRTSEILSRVPASRWRHVPSADNPADSASRGMTPAAFLQHHLWFQGPSWLLKDPSHWPAVKQIPKTTEEKRNLPVISNPSTITPVDDNEIISRFSSLGKLVRVTALIFRFYNKCKKIPTCFPKHITVPEFNFSLNRLIQVVQHAVFAEDIYNVSHGKYPSNQLRRLNPFVDKDNFLRVGGRIQKSFLPYESKHQLILPKKHPLTILLIDDAHTTHLHAGPQSVQYLLLQKYWILSARDIIRQRTHRCVRCFRARPARPQPAMAPLPAVRLKPERPFLKTAVDYAGPFYVRANKVRNAKIVKCYVAVFVCMSVKAVHLELVSELSTEGFLAALRRFTSRRGLCTDIFSDCGKNFVGCDNYLKELYTFLKNDSIQNELNSKTLQQGITWHFQPPYASHFGGLFEAGVKSFKHHLYRVLGTHTQTYDEMHTLLCQIEAVLNSRPLCVLSADAIDPLPLTPSHFLIGGSITAIPDVSLTDVNPNRLTRWRWVQQCIQYFWKRWSREYLHEIQQRSKWFRDRGTPIREGTIVVMCDDHLPPLQWRLARVHALHPGSDNVTRVVTLQTGNSFFKRPVVKICPLPLE